MKRDSSPLDGSEDEHNYGCPVCGGKGTEIMDVESTVFRCKDCKILYSFRDGEKVAIIGNPFDKKFYCAYECHEKFDPDKTDLEWRKDHSLLPDRPICPQCGNPLTYKKDEVVE